MLFRINLLLLLFFGLNSCNEEDNRTDDEIALDDQINRILFIGNSLTFYNDMPDLFGKIANSQGHPDSTYVVNSAYGGYSFRLHTLEDLTLHAIKDQPWDWVILQESSSLMAFPDYLHTHATPFAFQLDSLVNANNSATKIMLYMANGHKEGAPSCEDFPDHCTHDKMVDQIRISYQRLADTLNADVAPAGVLWKLVKHRDPDLVLHDPDIVHPNLLGSYLSALTIYAAIFETEIEPSVLAPETITSVTKSLMIESVNDCLINNSPDWRTY